MLHQRGARGPPRRTGLQPGGPVPAQAPFSARLGPGLCLQALLSTVGLQLPVLPGVASVPIKPVHPTAAGPRDHAGWPQFRASPPTVVRYMRRLSNKITFFLTSGPVRGGGKQKL